MQAVWQFLTLRYPESQLDRQGYWHNANGPKGDRSDDPATPAQETSWFTPLTQYGLVSVTGADAGKFLQGQTSCDWRQIVPGRAGRGSYCNLKGRVMTSFLAAMADDGEALLRMRHDLTTEFCSQLAKYIVFSKAAMTDISQQWGGIGIAGPAAKQLVAAVFGATPDGLLAHAAFENGQVVQLDEHGQQFECWLPATALESAWQVLAEQAEPVGSNRWETLNIRAGIGEVCAATRDLFLPQMLNMQLTDGVSFKKGCYTGQEVIARMEYRGNLKKRLYRVAIDGLEALPEPGASIVLANGEQSAGNLVSASLVDGAAQALVVLNKAVLNNTDAQAATLHLASANGPVLELAELPYPIPEKD